MVQGVDDVPEHTVTREALSHAVFSGMSASDRLMTAATSGSEAPSGSSQTIASASKEQRYSELTRRRANALKDAKGTAKLQADCRALGSSVHSCMEGCQRGEISYTLAAIVCVLPCCPCNSFCDYSAHFHLL